MLIEMKTLQAGPKGVREAGKTYEVPDKEARDLIKNGYAVEAKRTTPVTRATGRRGQEQAVATPPKTEDAGDEA